MVTGESPVSGTLRSNRVLNLSLFTSHSIFKILTDVGQRLGDRRLRPDDFIVSLQLSQVPMLLIFVFCSDNSWQELLSNDT